MATIHWEVEDGYVGKSRPQHTNIPDEELDDCENEKERNQLIEDYVQEDFDQKITWYIKSVEAD